MALSYLAKAAFAALSSLISKRVARSCVRSVIGMSAAGNAVDYRSVVVDMTLPGIAVPVSEATLAVMDEVEEVPEGGVIPIDLIDSLPSKGSYPKRDPKIITTHYWHHSASDTLTSFEALAKAHIARGWPGIGYTGGIRSDGRFYVFHDLGRTTNHTAGHNSRGVATVLVGNFESYDLTPKMYATCLKVRGYYRSKGIMLEAMHRDVRATACPGRYAVKKLRLPQ